MNIKLDNWVISRLSEPFAEHELKWRPGSGSTFLAYIDARQVVDRLNHVVGAENWHDAYSAIDFTNTEARDITDIEEVKRKADELKINYNDMFWMYGNKINGVKNKSYITLEYNNISYGGIKCSLNVLGIVKEDVGTASPADQMKGAHSDALKRAAVKFGIGAYLYDLKNLKGGFVENKVVVEPPELPEWALPVQRGDPDEAILKLFEKAKANTTIQSISIEKLFNQISVMGNYNTSAPLVLKRHIYESLTELLSYNGDSQ